jgi:CubicO group peptidase (beta-lactamase class C family)
MSTASAEIDSYVRTYSDTNNFSGVVLVAREGHAIFARAYGHADSRRRKLNTLRTRFHLASMSMQFTAAATLRLVDAGRLTLDTPVSAILPDYPRGDRINVRHLLTQTSGIADINELPDYSQILQAHQTPTSLVERMKAVPPARDPGEFVREEHSAYNLLALIVERKTGMPFAAAVKQLVFAPLGMHDSGIDDDGPQAQRRAAVGLAPEKVFDVRPAERIHWSAKAGNASAYSTAADELRWLNGLFDSNFLSPALRSQMFDLTARVGYGWFKSNSTRFGAPVYWMTGRAPGFASAMNYFPQQRISVVLLSNVYASFPSRMSDDITAIVVGLPYDRSPLQNAKSGSADVTIAGDFHYGADFYQPNAMIQLRLEGNDYGLRWPSGETTYLIPSGKDHFVDRSYGVPVEAVRDGAGRVIGLKYDRFLGDHVGGG